MISDKIHYRVVYNRKKQLRPDGTALLQIEARLHGRRVFFSSGICIRPESWRAGLIVNHPNAAGLNALLYDMVIQLESVEIDMWKRDITPTLAALKEAVKKKRLPENDFLAWATRYVTDSAAGRRKRGTIDNLRSTLHKLRAFRKTVSFDDLTYNYLIDFERFLTETGSADNTIIKHMRQLRTMVKEAINQRYIPAEDYPFANYKMRTMTRRTEFLTPSELHRLEQRKPTRLTDAFLFCCYTGVRFSDFKALRTENLAREGRATWLRFATIKTGIDIALPLDHLFGGRALQVLDRWSSIELLKRIGSNSSCNRKLKALMLSMGIERRITWHTARHTCACNLLHQGVPVTTVQRLLGHTDIETTMGYVDLLDSTVLADLKGVKNRRK